MRITISSNSNLAIYEQIVNQVRDSILRHDLLPGEAMPSIRGLARDLEISVITSKRAYDELEKEGLIESVAGKGFYVCEYNAAIVKEKQTILLEQRFFSIIQDAKKAGLSLEDMTAMLSVLYETDHT